MPWRPEQPAVVAEYAQEAVRERGRFTLVLAGGSTPEKTYRLLAEPAQAAMVAWPKTFVFFGDERFVPPDDPRSNFGMARSALLAHVPIPAGQVFPVPTDRPTAAEAAAAYTRRLGEVFAAAPRGPPPRFDLILLGLGEDGHTASLFPGAAALAVRDTWVTWSPPGTLPPPVDRVTMTYPVLNAARQVLFPRVRPEQGGGIAGRARGTSPARRPAGRRRSARASDAGVAGGRRSSTRGGKYEAPNTK